MAYPCRLLSYKECDGCGKCQPEQEYVLYCDNCGREIEDLEQYVQIDDHAYCEECVDNNWRQWYKSPGGWPARIRKFRLAHKMTQDEFAKKLNVSKTLVSGWERGARRVQQEYIDTIYNTFGEEP